MALTKQFATALLALPCLFAQTPETKNMDTATLITRGRPAAASLNQFGLRLLAKEAAAKPNQNVFLSPLSIYLALAMTENGAEGKTRTAMRHALEIPDAITEDQLHEAAGALMQSLQAQRGVELSIANALWSGRDYPLAKAFVDKSKALYAAEAQSIDFKNPETAKTINDWVSEKTKTKIPTIVTADAIRDAVAVLTNAVYFMGRWSREFSETATADADFHLVRGTTKKVRMMHQTGLKSTYRQGENFEAAVLPYKNSGIEMFAILPKRGVSPEQALAKVSPEKLSNSSEPFELDLKLPKFSLDYSNGLKHSLSQMGMDIAFQYPGAEFAPLGSPLFYIGEVLHKTRLEVDEKGTVAAAATAVVMLAGAALPRPMEKKVLVFDRPFAVVIADAYTRAILFAGVVYEP